MIWNSFLSNVSQNKANDCVYQATGSIEEFAVGGRGRCELTRLTFPLIDRSVDQISMPPSAVVPEAAAAVWLRV